MQPSNDLDTARSRLTVWLRDFGHDKQQPFVDDLTAVLNALERQERELLIANKKNEGSLANNLCPNHRDKQRGKECLACIVERQEREAVRLRHILEGTAYRIKDALPYSPDYRANATLQMAVEEATAALAEEGKSDE